MANRAGQRVEGTGEKRGMTDRQRQTVSPSALLSLGIASLEPLCVFVFHCVCLFPSCPLFSVCTTMDKNPFL